MPAIYLPRLKKQCTQLANSFDQPASFIPELHSLLEDYADRVHRPGQSGQPAPLVPAYNVPKPVLREVQKELLPLAREQHQNSLHLAQALWEQKHLEFMLLAASLLGALPGSEQEQVLELISSWLEPTLDAHLVDICLSEGLRGVRSASPETLLKWIEEWLGNTAVFWQIVGLRALRPIIEMGQQQHFPVVFRLLAPLIRSIPSQLRTDLLETLRLLARQTPHEVAYFFLENLGVPNNPDVAWLARQCVREMPAEVAERLRVKLRGEKTVNEYEKRINE